MLYGTIAPIFKNGGHMCGIIAFAERGSVAPHLIKGLERLEYRGYDSAGLAVMSDSVIRTCKTTKRVAELEAKYNSAPFYGSVGIGHTRWATHGAPTERNAHPHLSEDGHFAVVHNGIIENYEALKAELLNEGHVFKSDTDTETIVHLVQKYYRGNFLKAVLNAAKRLEGTFAAALMCIDEPDTVIAIRSFSPLIIGIGKDKTIASSDISAVAEHTKKAVYLNDGEAAVLRPDSASFYNFNGEPVEKELTVLDVGSGDYGKNGMAHYMLKEIFEQPDAVRRTLGAHIKNGEVAFDFSLFDGNAVRNIKKICFVACGSAYHAGVAAAAVFRALTGIASYALIASEFRYMEPMTDSSTLVVPISQSGETADTLASLREAKRRGARTVGVVNVVDSLIAKECGDVIYTCAGQETAVATTKGYTTQLAALYMFAIWFGRELGALAAEREAELTKSLTQLPHALETVLRSDAHAKKHASDLKDASSMFFIGRGLDYAAALEAALKMKEITYIHAESCPAGELKHGTISLVEPGMRVFAFLSQPVTASKTVNNIKEVRARGAYTICCAPQSIAERLTDIDELIVLPDIEPLFFNIIEVVPFQFYAYYTALARGCDIDKPRNLAKSVTVE